MKSIAVLFPGQGSQYVGMGKDLDTDLFQKANEVLGFSLSTLCLEGPVEELKLTHNTQPAIVTHSVAIWNKLQNFLKENNQEASCVLGHSVGEYAALVAAGTLSFEDAVKAVNLRGKYMQEAVPVGAGKMYAVLRLSAEIVGKACEAATTAEEPVEAANFNSPEQVVISGSAQGCQNAIKWLEENSGEKRIRAMELPVSAPFHCSLMKPAEEKLAAHLASLNFQENQIPYVANIDAKLYAKGTAGSVIRDNLIQQVCGSVRWLQSIQTLPKDTLFIECGPSKVLEGLVKKIRPEAQIVSLDTENSWETLKSLLA